MDVSDAFNNNHSNTDTDNAGDKNLSEACWRHNKCIVISLFKIRKKICLREMVYDFAAYISPLRFNAAYPNLTAKLEWNGTTVKGCFFFLHRGFSTFHAVFVSVASIYLLVISDQFDENVHGDSVVNSTTSLSEAVMGISLGYFIADLTMIFWHFPTLGGIEYVFHHCLSMFSIILSVTSGQAQFYIFIVLLYLDTSGQKCSKAYTLNGIALFLGWLVARILVYIYYFVHMYFHFHQVVSMLTPSYGSTGPVCDESSLVLENHQRIDQNNLQGKTQGVKKR
ncbi:hypothetical protein F2Q70_00003307 [Brassica cretica]|uniref:TLC domain-containing protein n=1 Tax=Brassica cretica TaxID=69181 RepID=A0A8S9J1J0_BRACR|nr:hypothetical protein F2Q70_00003307 [Brassica cretica]